MTRRLVQDMASTPTPTPLLAVSRRKVWLDVTMPRHHLRIGARVIGAGTGDRIGPEETFCFGILAQEYPRRSCLAGLLPPLADRLRPLVSPAPLTSFCTACPGGGFRRRASAIEICFSRPLGLSAVVLEYAIESGWVGSYRTALGKVSSGRSRPGADQFVDLSERGLSFAR